jgi:hypothetical protein
MTRGFSSGLVHGIVLGAACLLALSLAFPMSGDEPAPRHEPIAPPAAQPAAAAATHPETPEPAPEPAASDSQTPDHSAHQTPSAAQVDLPVGSEFGRGGDVLPILPAPLSSFENGIGQAEAPAVSAPAAEPAPVAVIGENHRPETSRQGMAQDLAAPEPGGASPDLETPDVLTRPGQQPAPLMGEQGGQDALPARMTAATADAAPPQAVSPPAADTGRGDADTPQAPAMPAPTPDLSLPPDLSDLRMMERD